MEKTAWSLSEAPAGSRTLEEEGRTVSSRGFQGSFFLAPPLLPLPPVFSFQLFIPGREVNRAGDTSYLCLCDPCKPGYALLNRTEGRGRSTSQSPLACGRTQRNVLCSSMFYPVSTHTCTCACRATALSKDSLGVKTSTGGPDLSLCFVSRREYLFRGWGSCSVLRSLVLVSSRSRVLSPTSQPTRKKEGRRYLEIMGVRCFQNLWFT